MEYSKRKQDEYYYSAATVINVSMVLLMALHIYIMGFGFFVQNGLSHPDFTNTVKKLMDGFVLKDPIITKIFVLLLCSTAAIIAKKYKSIDIVLSKQIQLAVFAGGFFLLSHFIKIPVINEEVGFIAYVVITIFSLSMFITAFYKIARYLDGNLKKDLFNKEQETFPQEERKLSHNYSVNLPTKYVFNKKEHDGWINLVNLFRALLVVGSPGSGKTRFVIRHIIDQLISKNFSMIVYDFKFPSLSKLAYNNLLEHYGKLDNPPKFYCVNFDKPMHQVNPLEPGLMRDVSDAYQAAKSTYKGLNRDTGASKDPFWEESAINTIAGAIWFLKSEMNGKYCTFPHLIELLTSDHTVYLTLMMNNPQCAKLIDPVFGAMRDGNDKLLNNMLSSVKVPMVKLASPSLYWTMCKSDFSLDINNPEEPKILCIANNDQRDHVYSAPISLIIDKATKLMNQKHRQPSALIFDEFPTFYFDNIEKIIATGRENKIATILGLQDVSQNEKYYGKVNSDIVFNITGNVIAGKLSGALAKSLSDSMGRIKMVKESITQTSDGFTKSKSTEMAAAVPVDTINNLTSGEVVGYVADEVGYEIELKRFHSKIQVDHASLDKYDDAMKPMPYQREISQDEMNENFITIQDDIKNFLALVSKNYELKI